MKTNFWHDVSKYGAFMALVQVVFSVLGLFGMPAPLSLLSLAATVSLLYLFTRRRAMAYGGDEGYGYGQCLKYIFWLSAFSGLLWGAWEVLSRNLLFPEPYEEVFRLSLQTMGRIYGEQQLDLFYPMMRSLFFSPIGIVVTCVLGSVVRGCFFGLVVAALAYRRAEIFSNRRDGEA